MKAWGRGISCSATFFTALVHDGEAPREEPSASRWLLVLVYVHLPHVPLRTGVRGAYQTPASTSLDGRQYYRGKKKVQLETAQSAVSPNLPPLEA